MGKRDSWPTTRPSLLFRIRDAQDGDAWGAFVEIYAPLVYRYCRRLGLQDADAQDATQDVLLAVRRFQYDPERGRFRSWLGTVTRREVQRKLKGAADRVDRPPGGGEQDDLLSQATDTSGDGDWNGYFHASILKTALERVRPEFDEEKWKVFEAVAFRLRELDDRKELEWVKDPCPDAIARQVNRPVGWVYQVKSLILKRIEEEVLYLAEDIAQFVR